MPWYHYIATFSHGHLAHMRATRRDNLAIRAAAPAPSPNWRAPLCPNSPKAITSTKAHLALPFQRQL